MNVHRQSNDIVIKVEVRTLLVSSWGAQSRDYERYSVDASAKLKLVAPLFSSFILKDAGRAVVISHCSSHILIIAAQLDSLLIAFLTIFTTHMEGRRKGVRDKAHGNNANESLISFPVLRFM